MDDTVPPSAQPPLVEDTPYFHRGAIKDQEYFFGRERETREILGAVRRGQCVSIVGPWHIGKTSLLFHVKSGQVLRKHGLAPDKFVMVYCTGQGLRGDDQSNLYGYLLKKLRSYEAVERLLGAPVDLDRSKLLDLLITRLNLEELRTLCFTLEERVKDLTYDSLPGKGLEAKARELIAFLARRDQLDLLLVELFEQRPDLADEKVNLFVLDGRRISGGSPDLSLDGAYHELDELVKRLTRRGLRIVLLLDEFELFAVNPNTQESFFRNLQALQAEHTLTVVTSSRIALHELSDLNGACLPRRFFLMFLPLNLGLFRSDEAISLIMEPSRRAGVAFSEPTGEFILDVAGLHPFFIQVACDSVFDQRCTKPQLDASDYDGLCQEIGGQLKGMFRYYWEMLDPEQQSALVDLGTSQAGPGRGQWLEELVQQGLVVRKGHVYDYVSTSFKEFVQKHQSTLAVRLGSVRILEEIGSGGMGTVYKAYQSSLKRYVAVKVLARDAKREGFQQRFEQEAQALARLRHANILSIHGFDQEGERAYIVMDYVSGGTLADLISDGLSLRDAIDIAVQIGDALHYAHQRGIVHRDVKPTNVLIDEDGGPLLTDFGLVKLLTAPEPVTEPGVGMGTAAYMAPEQASGGEVDARSDVYALGIVLYEMVTGCLPFEAEDGITMVLKKLQESPPPPSRFKADLPAKVEHVILKAMAFKPEDRYQSALEMTEALRELQSVVS
jgi:predicted Ser/Thr protein kinase